MELTEALPSSNQFSSIASAVIGKAESSGDSGSVLQQLSYRKAAMFALAKQAEASSQAASKNEKELKHSLARIKELKAQLSKVTFAHVIHKIPDTDLHGLSG